MKKQILTIIAVLLSIIRLTAQDNNENSLTISGYFQTDERFLQKNDNPWIWNENRLSLQMDKNLESKASFHSEIWLRNMGLPNFYDFASLYNKGIIDPYSLEVREAYFQISDFLMPKLDLTAGRQIINWGTADKINPTSNLNPYDFEDILDFGRHRGTEALKLDYYFNDNYSFELVAEPFFRPANMPVGIFSDMMSSTVDLPEGMTLASLTDSLFLPSNKIKDNVIAGAKFKGFAAGFDFSFTYVYGRDYLPQPNLVDITPIDQQGNVSVDVNMYYPRQHIFGFDMAGNIAGAGVWAEVAAFLPTEDVKMTTNIHTVNPVTYQPMTITADSVLIASDKPYFKYVVGMDYNFANGIYLNLQYNHGFLHERGSENLNDYYFLHIDKSFFYDKLKLTPVNGAFVVTDYENLKDNYTFVYMPEISYKPVDDAEITLSAAVIDGKGQNLFTAMKDLDMFIIKFKYNF